MGKGIFGIIKSFWKIGAPWVIMFSLAILYSLYQWVESLGEEEVSIIIDIVVIGGALALLVLLIRSLYSLYKKIPQPLAVKGLRQEVFSDQPWLFNKRIIIITAKVERVINFELLGAIRRLIEHLKWVISNQEVPYIPRYYQRVLLSSPKLESGQYITLFIDRGVGKNHYTPGVWLEIQGQYIDQKSFLYGFWGSSLTFYGGIHTLPGNNGSIKVLGTNLKPEEVKDIEVLPRNIAQPH